MMLSSWGVGAKGGRLGIPEWRLRGKLLEAAYLPNPSIWNQSLDYLYAFLAPRSLTVCKVREQSPKSTLTPGTDYRVQRSPKPPLGSVICQKDSQNSIKTVTLKIMVYFRKRMQIKISQLEKTLGAESRRVLNTELPVVLSQWSHEQRQLFLAMICTSTHGVLTTE